MNKSQDKNLYLTQVALGKSHRHIAKNMANKFSVSTTIIRDELLADGVIKLIRTELDVVAKKKYTFYGIVFQPDEEQEQDAPSTWPDGTKKSRGNAFDLSRSSTLFSRTELATIALHSRPQTIQRQITTYSRA